MIAEGGLQALHWCLCPEPLPKHHQAPQVLCPPCVTGLGRYFDAAGVERSGSMMLQLWRWPVSHGPWQWRITDEGRMSNATGSRAALLRLCARWGAIVTHALDVGMSPVSQCTCIVCIPRSDSRRADRQVSQHWNYGAHRCWQGGCGPWVACKREGRRSLCTTRHDTSWACVCGRDGGVLRPGRGDRFEAWAAVGSSCCPAASMNRA